MSERGVIGGLVLALLLVGCDTQVRCARYDSARRDTEFRNFEKCCPEGWDYVYNHAGSWEGWAEESPRLKEYLLREEEERLQYTCDRKGEAK